LERMEDTCCFERMLQRYGELKNYTVTYSLTGCWGFGEVSMG
jgi:hypothetical protein